HGGPRVSRSVRGAFALRCNSAFQRSRRSQEAALRLSHGDNPPCETNGIATSKRKAVSGSAGQPLLPPRHSQTHFALTTHRFSPLGAKPLLHDACWPPVQEIAQPPHGPSGPTWHADDALSAGGAPVPPPQMHTDATPGCVVHHCPDHGAPTDAQTAGHFALASPLIQMGPV